jgi:hypothetical protein
VLLTGGLFALLYGIIEGPERGWGSAPVIGGFVIGAGLVALFTAYARKARRPLALATIGVVLMWRTSSEGRLVGREMQSVAD